MSYPVPVGRKEICYEIKKSRFIAWLQAATSRAEAMQALADAKAAYPDARHHCWAYQIGSPVNPSLVAFSDDGEPGGTAGKPILNVLQHKGIGDAMLIVTRYFGGIKLGAGGLVRAYGQAAQKVFEVAELVTQEVRIALTLECDYASEQWLRHQLTLLDGRVDDQQFGAGVSLSVSLPGHQRQVLEQILAGNAGTRVKPD